MSFIDEIENGLHYSVHKDVWRPLELWQRQLDIQVFATTHSYEMIRAAYEAFKEEDRLDEFRFTALDRKRHGEYRGGRRTTSTVWTRQRQRLREVRG